MARGRVLESGQWKSVEAGTPFEKDGKQLLADLKDRLEQSGLSPHEARPADRVRAFRRPQPSRRRAATRRDFDFLGLTTSCGKTRNEQVHGQAKDSSQALHLRDCLRSRFCLRRRPATAYRRSAPGKASAKDGGRPSDDPLAIHEARALVADVDLSVVVHVARHAPRSVDVAAGPICDPGPIGDAEVA
jgi:hypothetical protein